MTDPRTPSVPELLEEIRAQSGPLPNSSATVLAEAERLQEKIEKQEELAALARQMGYARLTAFQAHHHHKGRWSLFVMAAMAWMIGFQSLLLALVGTGLWDFTPYQWLLPSLLIQNLAQIITLAAIIVKALFDRHKD